MPFRIMDDVMTNEYRLLPHRESQISIEGPTFACGALCPPQARFFLFRNIFIGICKVKLLAAGAKFLLLGDPFMYWDSEIHSEQGEQGEPGF